MNKILLLIISALMLLSFTGCGKDGGSDESSSKIVVSDSSSVSDGKVGTVLSDAFHSLVEEKPDISAQEAADVIISNEIINFKAMTMPVEKGLLTGFGNTEINDFKEGVMFAPAISSIPFVGYVFVVEDDANLIAFMNNLDSNADKRWNVCTEADSVIVDNVGNTVFFLMCPDKLEDEEE